MPAVVVHGAKDLRLEDVEPCAPGPGEVRVDIGIGGVCGSDLHYFSHGAVGAFSIKEPLVLGHEIAGTVVAHGDGVDGPAIGTEVVVDPRQICGHCEACRTGHSNLCPETRYLGSAARMPHVQGGFQPTLCVAADRAIPISAGLLMEHAVFAEPLAVSLHAVNQAGDIKGRHVIITGGGPIGLLCLLGARRAGAARITLVDRLTEPLELARRLGADEVIDTGEVEALPSADVAIEATGAPAALALLLAAVVPGSRVVLVGMLPNPSDGLPFPLVVTRELELVGSFRFVDEFEMAIAALAEGLDVGPMLTERLPVERAAEAFDLALDRRSSKVQIGFDSSA